MSQKASPTILRPRPISQRSFSLDPPSPTESPPSTPPSDTNENDSANRPRLNTTASGNESLSNAEPPPSRTRSILNLTSSTLFGIYSPTGFNDREEQSHTPWGTGAGTPVSPYPDSRASSSLNLQEVEAWSRDRSQRRRSSVLPASSLTTGKQVVRPDQPKPRKVHIRKKSSQELLVPFLGRTIVLVAVGVCYGLLIGQLHDRQQIAPVRIDSIDRTSPYYLGGWALAAVALGQVMPWLDSFWAGEDGVSDSKMNGHGGRETRRTDRSRGHVFGAPQWNDLVRSIGAFVGIAFAIRRLPWESTLQLSVTLALANPAFWYLLDRTSPGFVLSTTAALSGTAVILAVNPDLVPSPVFGSASSHRRTMADNTTFAQGKAGAGMPMVGGLVSLESVGVVTWIASVIFVSCLCFGNIGRRI